jgi:uncharacterized protein YecT (DUF1311 family)
MQRSLAWPAAVLGSWLGLAARSARADVDCQSDSLSQTEIAECTDDDYKAAQAQLDDVIAKLEAKIKTEPQPKDFAKAFEKSERRWETFRDDDCGLLTFTSQDGGVYAMVLTSCKTELTADRTAELMQLLRNLSID